MRFRSKTDEGLRALSGFGCCTDRRVNECGWCKTGGHQIADPEPTDSGIELIMRMDRERVAAIQPTWTPAATPARQLDLALEEQEQAEEWAADYDYTPMTAQARNALAAIERRQAWRR